MKQAFARAGEKKEGVSALSVIDAIIEERPDLKDRTFYAPSSGGACLTFIVGDEVFKAPRQGGMNLTLFEKEIANMERLRGRGIAAPELTCVGQKTYFYGMKRIPGIVMSEAMRSMTEEQKEKLAEDIGRTIADVANVFDSPDIKTAGKAGFTDRSAEIAGYLENPRTAKRFGSGLDFARRQVADYYARMQGRKFIGYHADLHEDNILVNAKTKRLSAFIDFGSVHYTIAEDAVTRIAFSFTPAAREKMWLAYASASGADKRDYYASNLVHEIDLMLRDRSFSGELTAQARHCLAALEKLETPPAAAPKRKQAPAC